MPSSAEEGVRTPLTLILNSIEQVVAAALAVAMAVASVTMFTQVIARYVFSLPIVWAEEFTVLLFAWITFLGSALVQRTDSHLSIDTLRRLVGVRTGLIMDIFRLLVIGLCSLILIWQGYALTARTWVLLYPAMEISRGYLYASVPVCFALGLVFVFSQLLHRLEKPPESPIERFGAGADAHEP